MPGDWKGLEKDLRRPSAMFQPVIARVRGPKEVQIRDRRAESRDGARGRIDRGSGGGASGLLCEGAHELVAGRLDARAASKPVVARASWSRSSEGVGGPGEALGAGQAAQPVVGGVATRAWG